MIATSESIIATIVAHKPSQVWAYRNTSNWTILKIRTEDGLMHSAKGTLVAEPKAGDRYKFTGSWARSQFSGQMEFAFAAAVPDVPSDPKALLAYAVECTKGFGEAKLAEIWEAYGPDWMTDPQLTLVKGITAAARFSWQETLVRISSLDAETVAVSFLLAHGCTINLAGKAFERWKSNTIQTVTADPYVLAELPFCSFALVDATIRKHFGIGDDDGRRLKAAILYAAGNLAQEQGTKIIAENMRLAVTKLMPLASKESILAAIVALCDENKLVGFATEEEGIDDLALADDFKAENSIYRFLKGLA